MMISHETGELTNDEYAALNARGDYFAAGVLRAAGSIPLRHARGIANMLARCPLHSYNGELLYPTGGMIWIEPEPQTIRHHYVQIEHNAELATERAVAATSEIERAAYLKVQVYCERQPTAGGWTHSIINYDRVLAEGLDGYAARIRERLAATDGPETQELYRALLIVVDAVDVYRTRLADYLDTLSFTDPVRESNRHRLLAVYRERVPMRPARGFFEAVLATLFLFAIDGSDDLGRIDQFLWPYYPDSLAGGEITRDEARALLHALWTFVDDSWGWNAALGGSTRDGREASNDLTMLCLEAAHGRRRPNLALRLRRDTPEVVWDAALDLIATGNGLPALYSEENYLHAMELAGLRLPDEDMRDFAFGGCTELMIHGCSNVGSLDADLNVIKLLEESLHRHLPASADFEALWDAFTGDLHGAIAELTAWVSRNQEIRATHYPQLIRTLLIDDCIDRGKNYQDGGARWNWSVINIVGLSNAIDALAAVQQMVFTERVVSADELLAAMQADYQGYEDLLTQIERCPRFGNDDPAADALAHRLSGMVYGDFKRYTPWRGGRFLPATIMFVTYGGFGQPVGATPDGRHAGAPVADSAGPVQGRDRRGPTAMLHSTACLQQELAPGTLVVNLRLAPSLFATPDGRAQVQSLVRGYFALGGLQLQINVIDQAILRDAIAHPDRHRNLVIRIGGYSEYFNHLDEGLKLSVLERTEHGM